MKAEGRILINKKTGNRVFRTYEACPVGTYDNSMWMEGEPLYTKNQILPQGFIAFPEKAWHFLYGLGSLMGVHFGDSPPTGFKGPFWWRRIIKDELDAYGIETDEKCVHTEHCCEVHGCKYRDPDCPVINGVKRQSFPCEDCDPKYLL